MDSTKALVPGTHLVLTDNETNVTREGTTLSSGTFTTLLSSKGSSNYNALQMEFRHKVSHDLDLNVNYTYGKTLGNSSNQASGSIANAANLITLHNLHYNYVPIAYDIRNALKLSGTYTLPFGKNKAFLSNGRLLNYIVGGWTAGIISIYQSGSPILLTGGLSSTINSASDGGVTFVAGTTAHDIQKSVHVTRAAAGASYVNLIDPKFQSTSTANTNFVALPTQPLASKAICRTSMDRSGTTSILPQRRIYLSSRLSTSTYKVSSSTPSTIRNGMAATSTPRAQLLEPPTALPKALVVSSSALM
ncbi:MAG: hypothetical protein ABI286_09820 [Edaphobacter sp.]